MQVPVPAHLVFSCRKSSERLAWLERLPETVRELESRWTLRLAPPFDSEEVSCSWVAPAISADGTRAILKIGMPHFEGAQEIAGLRFWDGDPTVRLLDSDTGVGAMLLERCDPGDALRTLPEPDQDVILAGLMRRLWRVPPHGAFRPLSELVEHWSAETLAASAEWPDPGLVREGLRLFAELPNTAARQALLATDLHAGNVLRAAREPWLVIDPKPFVGDPAYDATQHLFNCRGRLRSDPMGLIDGFSDLLEVDAARVRLWTFARAAAEPRDDWRNASALSLARALAP
jgi:streptomycin 6-kinase